MVNSSIKDCARKTYFWMLHQLSREIGEEEMAMPAVVFAPHPDDESLGCGGTILMKRRSGARVNIVFVTDGGKSHSRVMATEKMREIRGREAIEAAKNLGLEEKDLHFIHARNGDLENDRAKVFRKALEALQRYRPGQVFVPYLRDTPVGSTDHADTNWLVLTAIQKYGKPVTVFEYPVWYWQHWPWTSKPDPGPRGALKFIAKSLISALFFIAEINCRVDTEGVEDRKKIALESHRSQMTTYIAGVNWRTLSDVSGGQFVDCFFRGREFFRRYEFIKSTQQ